MKEEQFRTKVKEYSDSHVQAGITTEAFNAGIEFAITHYQPEQPKQGLSAEEWNKADLAFHVSELGEEKPIPNPNDPDNREYYLRLESWRGAIEYMTQFASQAKQPDEEWVSAEELIKWIEGRISNCKELDMISEEWAFKQCLKKLRELPEPPKNK